MELDDAIEVWLPLSGWEGMYEVSSWGRFKRVDGLGKSKREFVATPKMPNGYRVIGLPYGEEMKSKTFRTHRLICATFHGPAPTVKHVVNHKDGVKDFNYARNVEWITSKANSLHATQVLGKGIGVTNGRAKLTEKDVLEIREIYSKSNNARIKATLGKEYGVCAQVIGRILSRKQWSHI